MILTKLDGDARGGAALSIRHVTGVPIKFVGTGERPSPTSRVPPERMVSRILGMGDVLSLIEKAEESIDESEAAGAREASSARTSSPRGLPGPAEDGPARWGRCPSVVSMLPGMSQVRESDLDTGALTRVIAIVDSMTPRSGPTPRILNGSRKKRISRGCGAVGAGDQPAAQAVRPDSADDEGHAWPAERKGRPAQAAVSGPLGYSVGISRDKVEGPGRILKVLKIRLRRMGAKKDPFYRVVVSDSRSTPSGRFVDVLGTYDPRTEPAR